MQVNVATPMQPKYWRNARSNLQCFPMCAEFGTYTAFRESGRAHSSTAGQCKRAVQVRLGPLLPGCQLRHPEQLVLLARFTTAHEAVATHNRARLGALRLSMEQFRGFAGKCLVARRSRAEAGLPGLAQEGVSQMWDLMPSMWTLEAALTKSKRMRRAVSEGGDPLEDRFCLQVFLFGFDADLGGMGCIGATASSPFELESTRTMSRQRKAATTTQSKPAAAAAVAAAAAAAAAAPVAPAAAAAAAAVAVAPVEGGGISPVNAPTAQPVNLPTALPV